VAYEFASALLRLVTNGIKMEVCSVPSDLLIKTVKRYFWIILEITEHQERAIEYNWEP